MGACEGVSKFQNKEVNSKQYFRVASTNNKEINAFNIPNNKIKLEFTIQNCTLNDRYQVLAEFMSSNVEPLLTETARTHSDSITFNTCYICEYYFQMQQKMCIAVLKNGKLLGKIFPCLGMIVGSQNSILTVKIDPIKQEFISISAEGINNDNSILLIQFRVITNKDVNFKDVKNKFSYHISSNGRKVYQSESLSQFGDIHTANIPTGLLEPNFEITFLNSQQKKIVTKIETVNSFIQQFNNIYLVLNIHNYEYQLINKSQLLSQYSFIDYLKNGVQLALTIGIDFTASNGQIDDPKSLHYIAPGVCNDYELAIKLCGMIIAFYDYDQLFPVYGFGAITDARVQPPQVNMCFNINFQQDPNIHTIDNVINEYHNCLRKIVLAGPTQFCPIIRRVIDTIKKENNPLNYNVLMILTDGIIVDQQDTIDAIVEASFLPFSLIIIGIGNDHFREMIELDGDHTPLISTKGVRIMRDIVEFVHFNTYRNNPDALTAKVLEEIPKQVVEYYSTYNYVPNNLKTAQIRTHTMMENYKINNVNN